MRNLGAWIGLMFLAATTTAAAVAGKIDRKGSARALAARTDARLDAIWAEAKARPADRADDAEFLRRAYLDLAGTIPVAAEARDFLDDPDPDKRAALVDRLLDGPAFAARSTALWRRLLLPDSGDDAAQVDSTGLDAWLRRKLDEGVGDDRIVREILTTPVAGRAADDGAMARTDPSPAAFFAAKAGKPEAIAADSARAFLGLRLGCAECHDHPFARWKREEFWGFAAFFADLPTASADAPNRTMTRSAGPRRELTIPGTKTVVKAAHLDRTPPDWRPRADSREVLADWVTAPANPYFARAAVNRTWARLFGVGLIEPVDDLDNDEAPELAALLDEIAIAYRADGHDTKNLIRALMATRAYNLTSAAPPGESTSTSAPFARMPTRGLSAAQLVASLTRATGTDPGESTARLVELFAERDERATEAQTSILQALTLMNGGYLAGATRPDSGDILGAIAGAPYLDTRGRVEALYLAALARRPRPEEHDRIGRYVDRRPDPAARAEALADVFWAILNGPEFRLNH